MSRLKRKILTRTNVIISSILTMLGIGAISCRPPFEEPLVKYGGPPVEYSDSTVTAMYGVQTPNLPADSTDAVEVMYGSPYPEDF